MADTRSDREAFANTHDAAGNEWVDNAPADCCPFLFGTCWCALLHERPSGGPLG